MRLALILLMCAPVVVAQKLTIEQLFSRPFLWGTAPEQITWSKQGHTLAFLWNADGRRFFDLYAYHPDRQKLVRLTSLESLKDDLNRTEEEKDERQRNYIMPPEGLSGFQLSKNGALAAFAYKGDLYKVPTDGSAAPLRLTKTRGAESAPQLSPDGGRLAYIRTGQLHVQDLKTGQLSQITDLEGGMSLTSYRWSPDGLKFYYTVRRGSLRQMPLPNYSGRLVTARGFTRTVAGDEPSEALLYVIPAEGGIPIEMEAGPFGARSLGDAPDWSDDSRRLLRVVSHPDRKQVRILVWDVATGKATTVSQDTDERWVFHSFAGWSPDSQHVFYTSDRDGWPHLYRVPISSGGKPQQLTKGAWGIHDDRISGEPEWIGESIYYVSTEAGTSERHLYRIRADGAQKEKLSQREGLNVGYVSADGKHIAWIIADLKNPWDLWVGDHRVTQSPRPEFYKIAWPDTRFVSFPSRGDRKTVPAKVLLPPGYKLDDRAKPPRPAVFFIHGAGYATSVLKQWGSYQEMRFAFNAWLAMQGYVVLDMDYRGSAGYDRDWRTGVYLHMGGKDLDDVLGGIDYLRGLGNIDMKRVGIWGVSYGGFMTNMAMFLSPDTFRAGSSWAAVNDWENYNAGYTAERLTSPQKNPEAYRRSSPIQFSALLKNPLLIVHGMVDDNVLFQDAVQLTEKLIHEGKKFDHVYYPEESHLFMRDETLIDAFRRTAEWFERHLR